jgi:hypothetical protein
MTSRSREWRFPMVFGYYCLPWVPLTEAGGSACGRHGERNLRSGGVMLGPAGGVETAPSGSEGDGVALGGRLELPYRVLLVAAVLALALGAGLHESLSVWRSSLAPVAVRSHRGFSDKSLLSLPLAAQGPISTALGADGLAYRVSADQGGFRASSPAQHLSTSFTRSGVSVRTGAAQVGLSLSAIGYGSTLHAAGQTTPEGKANRVVYAHPGVSEWYSN